MRCHIVSFHKHFSYNEAALFIIQSQRQPLFRNNFQHHNNLIDVIRTPVKMYFCCGLALFYRAVSKIVQTWFWLLFNSQVKNFEFTAHHAMSFVDIASKYLKSDSAMGTFRYDKRK